jgi:ribose/xylose/arabinose/galactoside ABC-type transport system permease subunit
MTSNPPVSTPRAVLIYGRLGLIPFLAPVLIGWLWPVAAPIAGAALAVYAALILSFLGGGRWGIAVAALRVEPRIVSLAMLPTLAGFGLLMIPAEWRGWQMAGLAVAHLVQGLWDMRATTVPAWYASLRGQLTLFALVGLALGLAVFRG